MSTELTRMRPSLLVRVAIFWPLMSRTTEFWASAYWARSSSCGRSLATAIMIPKIHEIIARIARPKKTSAIRSFRSFGRLRGGLPFVDPFRDLEGVGSLERRGGLMRGGMRSRLDHCQELSAGEPTWRIESADRRSPKEKAGKRVRRASASV